MKKILLTATAFAALSFAANAQTRMTLHEEFTGENCGPCAATNPTFWTLCNTAPNPTKLIHIAYMAPIPSAGWFFYQDSLDEQPRETYYSVPFAPYGLYDGKVPDSWESSPGHPGYFHQTEIDSEAAIASPFTMTVTATWDAGYNNINVNVSGSCVTAYAFGAKLRVAVVQTLDFATSPGSNGETHFENVVRKMYPNATGTAMAASYAAGDPYTYSLTCAVPAYVDKSVAPRVVAWIQYDGDKTIAQAGQSPVLSTVPTDAAAAATTTSASSLTCSASPYSLTHSVTLKNTGTSTLTSANIYYSIDGGAYSTYNWTGSLAAGATATVALPASSVTVTSSGFHSVVDSVDMPNGTTDINPANNVSGTSFFIESTAGLAEPFTGDFESNRGQYDNIDLNNNGADWFISSTGTSTPGGHGGSTYFAYHLNYEYPAGEQNILTLPVINTTSHSAMSFWVAYRQYNSSTNDSLEVVYSTNCGSTWTSLWLASGAGLASIAADTNFYVPSASSDYKQYTVGLGTVPAGAIIAFRATSDFGNNLFLDDINVHDVPVSVANVSGATSQVSIYPNPAKESATLSFNLSSESEMQIQVIDAVGRVVNTVANGKMEAGAHTIAINTSALPAGVYNVVMHSDAGTQTQRLSVAK